MENILDGRIARYLGHVLPAVDFGVVPDHRQRSKVRRKAKKLLLMATVGLMGGRRGFAGTEDLSAMLSKGMRKFLGMGGRVPDTTLRDFMTGVDLAGLQRLIQDQAQVAFRRKSLQGLASGMPIGMASFDGKYDRAFVPLQNPLNYQKELEAYKEAYPYFQPDEKPRGKRLYGEVRSLSVCLVSPGGAPYLDCAPVPAATNEMGAFGYAFRRFAAEWTNRGLVEMVSVDAGMVSKENATLVHEAGFGYLMAVKETQPTILTELKRLLDYSSPDYVYEERYRGHQVLFRLWRTSAIAGWHDWKHLSQGMCIERVVLDEDRKQVSAEKRYFVSNVNRGRLSHAEWALVIRTHWMVENGAHRNLDVGMEEGDRPWTQEPHAMLGMAILRRLALTLLTLLRACYLRSREERKPTWPYLQAAIYDILRLGELSDILRARQMRSSNDPS